MKKIRKSVALGAVFVCAILILTPFVHAPAESRVVVGTMLSQEDKIEEASSQDDEDVQDGPTIDKFVVTAYYAPLPDQESYVTGSYLTDKILNGRGIATYSGKAPEIGHIAADLNILPLGTEVEIPGYGRGVVEDIGGRIKGYRLDVFMGHGDEGMRKALEWGKQILEIEVIEETPKRKRKVAMSKNN